MAIENLICQGLGFGGAINYLVTLGLGDLTGGGGGNGGNGGGGVAGSTGSVFAGHRREVAFEGESLVKRTGESRTYFWTFSDTPEILDQQEVVSVVEGPTAEPSGLTFGPPVVLTNAVKATITGGTNGTGYKTWCRVLTDGGAILTRYGFLLVMDP